MSEVRCRLDLDSRSDIAVGRGAWITGYTNGLDYGVRLQRGMKGGMRVSEREVPLYLFGM